MSLKMQVAPVKKALAAVRKMTSAGNRVVFEELGGSIGGYVQNLETGAKIPIIQAPGGGTYTVSIWRKKNAKPGDIPPKGSRFRSLEPLDEEEEEGEHVIEGAASSSSQTNSGFTRRAL
jgi:hypothetical protein